MALIVAMDAAVTGAGQYRYANQHMTVCYPRMREAELLGANYVIDILDVRSNANADVHVCTIEQICYCSPTANSPPSREPM